MQLILGVTDNDHYISNSDFSPSPILEGQLSFSDRIMTTSSMINTVVPTKSDSDVILCLQLLSKTLTCTLYLSISESIDHLCINPIQWIGLIHK